MDPYRTTSITAVANCPCPPIFLNRLHFDISFIALPTVTQGGSSQCIQKIGKNSLFGLGQVPLSKAKTRDHLIPVGVRFSILHATANA
jgi:hypothetical protein